MVSMMGITDSKQRSCRNRNISPKISSTGSDNVDGGGVSLLKIIEVNECFL